MALLASSRQIAPDPAETPRPISSAETAADLLHQFQHPQVPFRTIIVERHTEVSHEAQDLVSLLLQPIDDAPRSRPTLSFLRWRPRSASSFWRLRVQFLRLLYDLSITAEK